MSSGGHAFNDLGQLLSRGAEIYVGTALSRGRSLDYVSSLIDRRFGPLSDDDKVALISIASDGAAAGSIAELNQDSLDSMMAAAPVNTQLFGDQSQGGRVLLVADMSIDGGDNFFTQRIIFPDTPTIEFLQDKSDTYFDFMAKFYPKDFQRILEEAIQEMILLGIFAERRF